MAELFIKKAYKKDNPQCLWEKKGDECFDWAEWNIEGDDYCQIHAKKVLQSLKDHGIDVDIEKINPKRKGRRKGRR